MNQKSLRRAILAFLLAGTLSIAFPAPVLSQSLFLRGDCNTDSLLNIADAILGLGILFSGAGPADCEDACDSNDDGVHDISDGIRILLYLFTGGAPIPAPGARNCGEDPTGDDLDCQAPSC